MQKTFSVIEKRALKIKNKTLVFPEGEDFRVCEAVQKLLEKTSTHIVVLGRERVLKQMYNHSLNLTFIDPNKDEKRKQNY